MAAFFVAATSFAWRGLADVGSVIVTTPRQPPESAGHATRTVATPDALMPTVCGGIDGGTEFAGGSTTGGSTTAGSTAGGSTTGSVGGSITGSTGGGGFATDSQSAATLSAVSASPLSVPAPHVSESVRPSRRSTTSSPSPRLTTAATRPQLAELADSLQHPEPTVSVIGKPSLVRVPVPLATGPHGGIVPCSAPPAAAA